MKTEERCFGSAGERSVRRRSRSTNGVIFYHGPSAFDGRRIVAIATGITIPSHNQKTGPMIQTWILRPDVPPQEAARMGADFSVCGACPLRGNGRQRSCYVNLQRGPRQVRERYLGGAYETVDRISWSWAANRTIRFGSYGDPAAVPSEVWFKLAAVCRGWTGYTHHWEQARHQQLRWLLMASVDSPEESWRARSLGWRTYRIRLPNEQLLPFESVCPASLEAGVKTTCQECAQCNGAQAVEVRRDYAVIAHGFGKKHYGLLRVLAGSEVRE